MAAHTRIRSIVDAHSDFVARTLRGAGVPSADLDDEIQRTFIVVGRRLRDVQVGAERSFLFQVAMNLAAHARRSVARRREVPCDALPEAVEPRAPDDLFDRLQVGDLIDEIVGSMDEPFRSVLRLFAFEGMNLSEIATRLRIPRGTAASRLRRARAQIHEHVARELGSDLGANSAKWIDEPVSLWQMKLGALERALLGAGVGMCTASLRTKTLAVLGLDASAYVQAGRI
jgi:RNA polymerase sigma-70 factor (ECF subfamily)